MAQYPHAILEHKTAASCDHSPLLRQRDCVQACRSVPRSFKYELAWERHPELQQVVAAGWTTSPADSVEAMHDKLNALSSHLSSWERTNFGIVRQEIATLKKELDTLRSAPGRFCWKYALEAIIKGLLLYFLVHDNFLYSCYNCVIRKS